MSITTQPTVNHLSGEKAREQLSVTVMSVWVQERRMCQIVIEHKRISTIVINIIIIVTYTITDY